MSDSRPRESLEELMSLGLIQEDRDRRPREASGELMSLGAIQEMMFYHREQALHWEDKLAEAVDAVDPNQVKDESDESSIGDLDDHSGDEGAGTGEAEEEGERAEEEQEGVAAGPGTAAPAPATRPDRATRPAQPKKSQKLKSPAEGYDPLWFDIAVQNGRDESDVDGIRTKIKFVDLFQQGLFHPHDDLTTQVNYEENGALKKTTVVTEFLGMFNEHGDDATPRFRITSDDTDLDETFRGCGGLKPLIGFIKEAGFKAPHLSCGSFPHNLQVVRGLTHLGSFQYFKDAYHLYLEEKPQEWWKDRRGKGNFARMRQPRTLLQRQMETED